eukprot:3495536-Pyramimonas_sp.AAC.1
MKARIADWRRRLRRSLGREGGRELFSWIKQRQCSTPRAARAADGETLASRADVLERAQQAWGPIYNRAAQTECFPRQVRQVHHEGGVRAPTPGGIIGRQQFKHMRMQRAPALDEWRVGELRLLPDNFRDMFCRVAQWS